MPGNDRNRSGEGLRTILVCTLANNLTLGLSFGSFGALLGTNEQVFGVGRDVISFGMSALISSLGISTLLLGGVTRRLTPRATMAIGIGIAACANLILGQTASFPVALAMWSLLGVGVALAAILGPVTAVAERFTGRSGQVLGIVNLPLALLAAPWIIARLLPGAGREGIYLGIAILLVPVLALVLLLPQPIRTAKSAASAQAAAQPARLRLGRADFWLVTAGIAVIAGAGTAFTVHAMPFAESRGFAPAQAAMLLSTYSAAGIAGALFFGWLADRIGPPATLAISAAIQVACWTGLAIASVPSFLVLSGILGAASAPLTALHGAAMTRMFGADGVGRAMGISYMVKLPFLFGLTPAVGYIFTRAGNYQPAFLAVAACLAAATLSLLAGTIRQAKPGKPEDLRSGAAL